MLNNEEKFKNIVLSRCEEGSPLGKALLYGIENNSNDPDALVSVLLEQIISMNSSMVGMGKMLEEKERTRAAPDNMILSDGMVKQLNEGILTRDELNLTRQWFDSVQYSNNAYLEDYDYDLAKKIYETLGMRVPHSILEKR